MARIIGMGQVTTITEVKEVVIHGGSFACVSATGDRVILKQNAVDDSPDTDSEDWQKSATAWRNTAGAWRNLALCVIVLWLFTVGYAGHLLGSR